MSLTIIFWSIVQWRFAALFSGRVRKHKHKVCCAGRDKRRWKLAALLFTTMLILTSCSGGDWRTASRKSAGIAPNPAETREAVLQVYGADAWGWRGWFAIHTWIAAKKTGEKAYTVYDVVGWRENHNKQVLRIGEDVPDRYWYGAKPKILADWRGKGVDELIEKVDEAARAYPWKNSYKVFPGPNSNTFTGWVARRVPELDLALPLSAIGSSYGD